MVFFTKYKYLIKLIAKAKVDAPWIGAVQIALEQEGYFLQMGAFTSNETMCSCTFTTNKRRNPPMKGFKKIIAQCGAARGERHMSLSLNSPVHDIDHADVRRLHRIAMDILERAIARRTIFEASDSIEAWWFGAWYPATVLHPPKDGVVSVAWVSEYTQSPLPIEDIRQGKS